MLFGEKEECLMLSRNLIWCTGRVFDAEQKCYPVNRKSDAEQKCYLVNRKSV